MKAVTKKSQETGHLVPFSGLIIIILTILKGVLKLI